MIEPATDPAQFQNTFLDRWVSGARAKYSTVSRSVAQRRLERSLEKHLLRAETYVKTGVSPASNTWATTANQALGEIDSFCKRWGNRREDILRENPGLHLLLNPVLNPGSTQAAAVQKAVRSTVIAMLGAMALGALVGLGRVGYNLIVYHHW